MIIVAHEVDEVECFGHGGHVVGLVDGLVPGRDGSRQEKSVKVEFGSHLAQKLGVVLLVFGEAGTVFAAA